MSVGDCTEHKSDLLFIRLNRVVFLFVLMFRLLLFSEVGVQPFSFLVFFCEDFDGKVQTVLLEVGNKFHLNIVRSIETHWVELKCQDLCHLEQDKETNQDEEITSPHICYVKTIAGGYVCPP